MPKPKTPKAPKIKPGDVHVFPVDSVNENGKTISRAVVIKSAKRSNIKSEIPRSLYKNTNLIEPYLKPAVLDELLIAVPTHSIAVHKKSRLVAGLGIKIVARFNERDARVKVRTWENTEKEKRSELHITREDYKKAKDNLAAYEIEREKLRDWIDNLTDDDTLIDHIERFWHDYEAFGNANFEIRRDETGEIAKIAHVVSLRLKVTQGGEKLAFFPSAQTVRPTYFKRYGDPRHLNSSTGEWRTWQGTPGEDNFNAGEDWGDLEANEILRYISYSSRDQHYGIPTWYAGLADMIGGVESRDFMLKFFSEKAVPLYAVLMEGGSWSPETIATIQNFFRRELTGNYHATLALEVPTGGKITFEQISPEPRWLPFIMNYRNAVRDIIVSVHGLTPSLVGVIETAHLGGGDGSQQMEMVKTAEIKPRQEKLEWLINQKLIREGLQLSHVMIKFDEIDVVDEQATVSAVSTLYSTAQRPAITTNEARAMLRLEPVDAEWADEILISDPQFGLLPLSQVSEAVRQQAKAAQIGGQTQGIETQPQNASGQPAPDSQEAPDFQTLFAGVDATTKSLQKDVENAINAISQS